MRVNAISQILAVVIVVAVILAAFGGYEYRAVSSRSSPIPATTLIEYVTNYFSQTDTVILYNQSSTTYTCTVGTVYASPASTTSFVVENITGKFFTTITTITSSAPNQVSTTTITGYYPLTTYTTKSGNTTVTSTMCLPSPNV